MNSLSLKFSFCISLLFEGDTLVGVSCIMCACVCVSVLWCLSSDAQEEHQYELPVSGVLFLLRS